MCPQRAFGRQRLLRKHVERAAGKRAVIERRHDVGIDLQWTPPCVDQERAAGRAIALELAEQREIQDPFGAPRPRQQANQNFRPLQEGSSRVVPSYGVVSSAKAALESHVRQLAMELARPGSGVTVNAIRAGVT